MKIGRGGGIYKRRKRRSNIWKMTEIINELRNDKDAHLRRMGSMNKKGEKDEKDEYKRRMK